MKLDPKSDPLIRRYLLSAVSEEEQEQVETQLMIDDDFFQQVNLIEDELIEEYLDEELVGEDRRRFEDTFLCAPERQHKLRFTKALRVQAARSAQEMTPEEVRERHPWRERFLELFRIPRPAMAYAFASALLVLAVGGTWMIIQMSSLKGQISGLQAQQQKRETVESGLRAMFDKEQARADQLANQLQQERQKQPLTQLAMMRQPSFTLTSGAQRSAQSSTLHVIPKGAILVDLKLDLPENWKETYRVVLLSGGKEILSHSYLKAAAGAKDITVTFSVPAADLPSGSCEIRLYGTGENEILETYSVRIVKN